MQPGLTSCSLLVIWAHVAIEIIQPQGVLTPPELLLARVPLVLLGQSAVGAPL